MEVRCGGGDMSTWTGMVRNSFHHFRFWKLNAHMYESFLCTFSLNVFMTSINDLGYISMYQLISTCYFFLRTFVDLLMGP